MTSLRTQWGLKLGELNAIAKGASEPLLKEAEEFLEKGWINQKDQVIYLTQTGKLYADHIASELFF